MSNARSPREVCSTTIGTSGLIVLAFVSLRLLGFLLKATDLVSKAWTPRRRRRVPARGSASPFSGVQIFSRACACSTGDRLRARSAIRSIAWRAARSSRTSSRRPAERSCSRSSLASIPSRSAVGAERLRASPRSEGLIALGLDDRGDDRLAAKRELGFGLHLGDDLRLLATDDLQVGLARDAAMGERVHHPLPHLAAPVPAPARV